MNMKRKNSLCAISLILVIFISLSILGNTYSRLTNNYTYLGLLQSSPQEIIVENHYYYSLEEINDFKNNYSVRFLYFPVGRLIPNQSELNIYLNSEEVILPIVDDGAGGSWVNVSCKLFIEGLDLVLRFTHKKANIITFKDPNPNVTTWINPSIYINSDNATLIEVAENNTSNEDSCYEKAKKLYLFVKDHLEYLFPSDAPEWASQIYDTGYGQCYHFSRLFVALCRAVNISARTVQGYYISNDSFDIVHQWAEFRDENGYWHQVDTSRESRSIFDFSDPRYFDFYYADYQNPFDPSQTYFPSLWYTSGELSLKSVTRDLENNLEISFMVVNDSAPGLILFFISTVIVYALYSIIENKFRR